MTRKRSQPAPAESVSIEQATRRYNVSRATLQRRLAAGTLPDAHRVPGPKGDEWRIPTIALERLGYHAREISAPAHPATGDDLAAAVSDLADSVRALTAELRLARQPHPS